MTPKARAAMLRAVREAEEREAQAAKLMAKAQATLNRAEIKAEGGNLEGRAIAALKAGKVPVFLGNLLGPEGNVFNVVGALRSALMWANEQGYMVSQGAIDTAKDFRSRTYDQTLDLILEHYEDLDDSIRRMRGEVAEDDEVLPPRFGDNPIGGMIPNHPRNRKR